MWVCQKNFWHLFDWIPKVSSPSKITNVLVQKKGIGMLTFCRAHILIANQSSTQSYMLVLFIVTTKKNHVNKPKKIKQTFSADSKFAI